MLMLSATKKNPEQTQISNRIMIGTTINGEIQSKGDFRIDGKIVGKIDITGKLVLGDKGIVEGDIFCENANFSGLVTGKVEVKDTLVLTSTARIEGDIFVGKLVVEQGATFTGNCNMGAKVREISEPRSSKNEQSGKTA
jgi:cytoskeletal protein CcmA (bactofilin family)